MVTAYGHVGLYATPPIHICPQEPWEAQEYAHRETAVGSNLRFVSHLELHYPIHQRSETVKKAGP
jgi:hypothetical protein